MLWAQRHTREWILRNRPPHHNKRTMLSFRVKGLGPRTTTWALIYLPCDEICR